MKETEKAILVAGINAGSSRSSQPWGRTQFWIPKSVVTELDNQYVEIAGWFVKKNLTCFLGVEG